MKRNFETLHRFAFSAFPVMSIAMLVIALLGRGWPVLAIVLWVASAALLVVVLTMCIVKNVSRQHQAGNMGKMARNYAIAAGAAFLALVLLDSTTGLIRWGADAVAGLVLGFLSWYAKP